MKNLEKIKSLNEIHISISETVNPEVLICVYEENTLKVVECNKFFDLVKLIEFLSGYKSEKVFIYGDCTGITFLTYCSRLLEKEGFETRLKVPKRNMHKEECKYLVESKIKEGKIIIPSTVNSELLGYISQQIFKKSFWQWVSEKMK